MKESDHIPKENMEIFLRYLERLNPLPSSLMDVLPEYCSFHSFDKGEMYSELDDSYQQVVFLTQGLCRSFVFINGKKVTLGFYNTGQLFARLPRTKFVRSYSMIHFQFILPTQAVIIRYKELMQSKEHRPAIVRYYRSIIEGFLVDAYQDTKNVLRFTPAERYRKMVDENVDWVRRIPQKYIASYLGVTPQSLSRIRKKIIK